LKFWIWAVGGAVAAASPAIAEPLQLFNNRLFLTVTVNGTPASALLDSAAEMTVLDDDFARRLRLRLGGDAVAHGSGASAMQARFARRISISAANVHFRTDAAVLDIDEVSQRLIGRHVDLLLGKDYFDQARLRIDIEGGTIETAPGTPPPGMRLRVTDVEGNPAIPAKVEGSPPVEAVFDLGNGSEVMIGRAYALRAGIASPGRIVGQAVGGGLGGALRRDIVVLSSIEIAGRVFHDVRAAIDPSETAADLNIGTSILRNFIITTDFANHSLWLEPRQ
jgi:predicted aspartyl protease